VTAVAPVVIECKGTWVGWPGIYDMAPNEAIPESDIGDQAPTAGLTSSQVSFHIYGWNNLVTNINFHTGRASPRLKGHIRRLLQWLLQWDVLATFPLHARQSRLQS
jgi:hypothetical protein